MEKRPPLSITMPMPRLAVAAASLLAAGLPAQNFVPNGHFDQAGNGWTMTQFNDPLGTTGFAPARVTGNGPSMAVFGNFQTLTPVMSATYSGTPMTLPPIPLAVSFDVMWDKQVTTPIPYNTVNRVDLLFYDSTNTLLTTMTLGVPNQTALQERASFTGTFTPPAVGTYHVDLFLRHSNLANMPYTTWVDNVVIGSPNSFVFGTGCAGNGGFTPVIGSSNAPLVNTTNFQVELNDAWGGPTFAIFAIDLSRTSIGSIPLPYPIGGGCSLRVGTGALLTHLVNASGPGTGTAAQVLAVPNNPGLHGLFLYSQWGVSDPASASPLQVAVTAGFAFMIE
jgi:hypothetical protein